MPAKINWTDEMLDHLVRQREAGVPARKIAEELGVGNTTLEQKIAELCLEGQPLRKRVKQEWTRDDVNCIIQMARDGMTAPEIAEEIDRSAASVNSKLTKLRKAGMLPWVGQGTGHKHSRKEQDAEVRALLRRFTAACEVIKEATGYGR
ncbi:hypothetical protein DW766_14845 [Butyricicoccus sp. AM29-23AC]|nr:hypothetical protein DW766_14845 [Butyricicoccus sp. AM29-23AC]